MKLPLSIYTKGEPHFVCYLWRALLGPASLLDGLIWTLSLGFVNPSFTLETSRKLVGSRIKS